MLYGVRCPTVSGDLWVPNKCSDPVILYLLAGTCGQPGHKLALNNAVSCVTMNYVAHF